MSKTAHVFKELILSILLCLSGVATLPAQTAEGYLINGVIRGTRAEGKKVYLVNAPWAISKKQCLIINQI